MSTEAVCEINQRDGHYARSVPELLPELPTSCVILETSQSQRVCYKNMVTRFQTLPFKTIDLMTLPHVTKAVELVVAVPNSIKLVCTRINAKNLIIIKNTDSYRITHLRTTVVQWDTH